MAEDIGSLAVKIGLDSSGFQAGVGQINKSLKVLDSEFKMNTASLGANAKGIDGLRLKSENLAKSMDLQKQKVTALETAYNKSVTTKGKDAKATQDLEIKLNNAKTSLINMGTELNRTNTQIATQTNSITKLGEAMKKVGTSFSSVGDSFKNAGSSIAKTGATITAAFAVIGTGSLKSYEEVKTGTNEIARLTGATGQKFEDLKKVYEDTARESANSFEDIGTAVGSVSVRLDLTGDKLKQASLDFMKFAKVNKIDVTTSVALVSRAMGDAGIKATEYKEVLDLLTTASQKSGIQVSVLAENLAKYGAPMRALGFDTKETVALFSGWEKAGVNTELAFGGMKKAIGNWGKAGKDSALEFKKMLKDIGDTPTLAKATTKAIEVFGIKAGPDLADAIKGGRFAYEDFLKILEGSNGTLDATAKNMAGYSAEMKKAWHSVTLASAELGESIAKELAPIMKSIAETIKDLTKVWNGLSDSTKSSIARFGLIAIAIAGVTAALGAVLIGIGGFIKGIGAFVTFGSAMAIKLGIVSAATTGVGVAAAGATPGVASLGAAIWTAMLPLLPYVAAIGAVGLVIGGIALKHKKQADEVKKTEEAYKKFNETLSGGSTKDLKEYVNSIEAHQVKLIELRKKLEESANAIKNNKSNISTNSASLDYNKRKNELENEIALIKKQGFTIDETTGKIAELAKVQNRINTKEQLDKITEVIEKKVDESTKTVQLIDRYTQLNAVKKRTVAEDVELSNTAKELNGKYNDLKISIDKNGNAIISNISLLGKKKTALEIDTQMIKANAYDQAKSAIYSEQIEIGRTKFTINEIEKRMKARDAEAKAGMVGIERQTPQAQAEGMAYLDAYIRLQAIKSQIQAINIPQASSSSSSDTDKPKSSSSGSKTKATVENYDVGIEATSKYSKVLVELDKNLSKVDTKIEGIQNRIETSKTIGTVEELAKATKEQTNLYQAQIEKIKTLGTSDKTLNDNKQKLIKEFKNSFASLKNTDLSKWEESDFNNFLERTYKQTTITDKARSEALKKGQKYSQELIKDLAGLNNKIEEVGNSLIDTKNEQIETLKDLDENAKSNTIGIAEEVDKLNNSIKNSLKLRYEDEEKAQNESINNQIENNNKLKEDTLKSIDTVYNAKMKILDDETKRYDIANKDSEDAAKESELRKILSLNYSKKKKDETQIELNKLLKDKEERKYKESIELQKENLKEQNDKDKLAAETTATTNDNFYKNELVRVKTFYENKTKEANIDAEAQSLIVSNNQTEIVALLKTYDKDYAKVGASLGTQLVEAFKDKLHGLADVLNGVFDSINKSVNMSPVSLPSVVGVGTGVISSSSSTTNNTTTYGSLLSTDKIVINNGMDIETLATELAFYMKQKSLGGSS